MSLYDIIMLVVFAGAILFGYWKGLAWQIASLAAVVASYFVSMQFREPLSRYISAEEPWNRIAAMLILFMGTSLLIWSIYASVSKSLKKMEMKGFDRQAGALLGAVKGALLCMIITMFSVSLLGQKAHDAIHNSRSGRYVVRGINQVSAIVPKELKQYVEPHVQNFQNAIGHELDLPDNQYPQFNDYPTAEQGIQDPNSVPRYSGQWQLNFPPAPNPNQNSGNTAGYAIPTPAPTLPVGYPSNVTGQNGYQPIGNQPNGNQQTNTSPTHNGWPDVNYRVNTRDVIDTLTKAGAEAVQKAFDNPSQQ